MKIIMAAILSLMFVTTLKAEEVKKNRVRVIMSSGPTGLNRVGNTVELERGPVAGVGYDRSFKNNTSIGIQVHTNGQVGVSLGLDF